MSMDISSTSLTPIIPTDLLSGPTGSLAPDSTHHVLPGTH
jgi:hypothetical protein